MSRRSRDAKRQLDETFGSDNLGQRSSPRQDRDTWAAGRAEQKRQRENKAKAKRRSRRAKEDESRRGQTPAAEQQAETQGLSVTYYRKPCACGQWMSSSTYYEGNQRCRACYTAETNAARDARREDILELWNEGRSLRDIAREIDSTESAIGAEITRMRQAGWPVAYRRKPR